MSRNRKNKREKNTITAFCEANFPRVVTTVMTLHIKPFPQLLSVLENPFLLPASDALTISGTALCSPKGFMASHNTEQPAIMANLTAHHSSPNAWWQHYLVQCPRMPVALWVGVLQIPPPPPSGNRNKHAELPLN